MKIFLSKSYFKECETVLVECDGLKASIFKYNSGIEAVRFENKLGHIIILPYNGQMIWDAVFYGRSLKMQTPFVEPQKANVFGETYGCYLMHCGMSSMGVPKENDNHPAHGHLPYANMKDAIIQLGNDKNGNYIQLLSSYERNVAFDEHYIAIPSVRLYENSSILQVNIYVQNLSRNRMSLMYLCHINNKIVENAQINQTLAWDKKHMSIQDLPENADYKLKQLHRKISENPALSNPIKEYYDPEICFFLRDMRCDENGYAHFLHELPDGSADYTYFDSSVLNHGVRWIAYHQDCEAMGMVLPGTAESEGYTKELNKGNMRYLDTNEVFEATVYCGALKAQEVPKIKQIINECDQSIK